MTMTRTLLLILSLLLFGLFVRLWVGAGSYPDIWRWEAQIDKQNTENDEQAEINRKLQADIVGLTKDTSTIEGHARSELGMVKGGETFYQVILKSDAQSPSPLPPSIPEKPHVE